MAHPLSMCSLLLKDLSFNFYSEIVIVIQRKTMNYIISSNVLLIAGICLKFTVSVDSATIQDAKTLQAYSFKASTKQR